MPDIIPTPVKTDSRTTFGISYFLTEEAAQIYATLIRESGDTYNGGYYHGMACGRDTAFDHEQVIDCRNCGGDGYSIDSYNGSKPCPACDGSGKEKRQLFAVTTA